MAGLLTAPEFSTSPPPSSTIAAPSLFTKNERDIEHASLSGPQPPLLFSKNFFQRGDPEVKKARQIYLKAYLSGLFLVILSLFSVFSFYWGSLWHVPAHTLEGWIVDFDGGAVGQAVLRTLPNAPMSTIAWKILPTTAFPGGVPEIMDKIKDDQTWVAVIINDGASSRLDAAIAIPDPSYNGSEAITVFGVEARNENAYRNLIRPFVQTSLDAIKLNFATQMVSQLSSSPNLASISSSSPQTIVAPISYTVANLLPYNQPVASAVVFIGLIYCLILSFFIVMIAYGAREESGINKILSYRSLVIVRLVSSALGYLCLSLFYTVFNLAFKLNIWHKYGNVAFLIFWMLNWIGMLSVGLALESLITVFTPKFIPFFMILWIIVNVSVCVFPIEVLPRIFQYGYAAPFYNISNSIRSLTFGTRDTMGLNFGVLLAWVFISCITLPLLQLYVRRKQIKAAKMEANFEQQQPQERSSTAVE